MTNGGVDISSENCGTQDGLMHETSKEGTTFVMATAVSRCLREGERGVLVSKFRDIFNVNPGKIRLVNMSDCPSYNSSEEEQSQFLCRGPKSHSHHKRKHHLYRNSGRHVQSHCRDRHDRSGSRGRHDRSRSRGRHDRSRSRGRHDRSRSRGRHDRSRSRGRHDRSRSRGRHDRSRSRGRHDRSRSRGRHDRSRSRGRHDRSRSRGRHDRSQSKGKYDQANGSGEENFRFQYTGTDSQSQSRGRKDCFMMKNHSQCCHDNFQCHKEKASEEKSQSMWLNKKNRNKMVDSVMEDSGICESCGDVPGCHRYSRGKKARKCRPSYSYHRKHGHHYRSKSLPGYCDNSSCSSESGSEQTRQSNNRYICDRDEEDIPEAMNGKEKYVDVDRDDKKEKCLDSVLLYDDEENQDPTELQTIEILPSSDAQDVSCAINQGSDNILCD